MQLRRNGTEGAKNNWNVHGLQGALTIRLEKMNSFCCLYFVGLHQCLGFSYNAF